MGIGVLEDSYLAKPPGTAAVGGNPQSSSDTASITEPKKDGDIILVPQPSDSPNDPLNLRRHDRSFPSLAAMRVFQGIASAPLETLVTSTVSDLFFVHQRGLRLSLWNIMLGTGVLVGQIIAGFIIDSLGVPAVFGLAAVAYCFVLPAIYFVVMETTYTRPPDNAEVVADKMGDAGSSWIELEEKAIKEPKEAYVSQLRLFRGRLSEQSFWKGVWKPFPLIAFPAVLFSTFVYASFFCWLLMIGVLSVNIFALPPYNLSPAQIGLTNLPLAIGALIFTPISGWMADAVPMWMAKRNNGIYEPEFRLVLMAIAAPLSTAGFIGFGISTEAGLPLAWCLVWITMHSVAVPFAAQAAISYVIDCHTQDANQAFVTINFVKALLSFIASSVSNGLLAKFGPKTLFIGIAMLNLGISTLTIPSYIYGKRLRSWVRILLFISARMRSNTLAGGTQRMDK
ncbi:hypothetical protein DL771_001691 [Monosporascus sp. 5C6A]|nr:hypothetical protein DL771_001691 [Monosporascus sp. 5C6A]